jgi:hypothetical protein
MLREQEPSEIVFSCAQPSVKVEKVTPLPSQPIVRRRRSPATTVVGALTPHAVVFDVSTPVDVSR